MHRLIFPLLILVFLPAVASAHAGHEHSGGLMSGWLHPFYGMDHIMAMMAVGLWASQLGRRALMVLPAAFCVGMLGGGWLSLNLVPLPGVEAGILASVLVFGVLLAIAARFQLVVAAVLVAGFAVFHGYAHLAEITNGVSVGIYATGFLLASCFLMAMGAIIGVSCKAAGLPQMLRVAGAAACVVAVVLALP